MDGMALLCNLHADGPETLRSLRDEGCTTLQDLHELDPERLSELIGFSPAAARRFLREGRMLLERLGDAGLETEEKLGAPAPVVHPPAADELPRNERAILARVLERWHEVDPMGPAESAVPLAAAVPTPAAPSPEPLGPDRLRPGLVEGLDAPLCDALAARGIDTLSELAELEPDELMSVTGLPFTRARRLQFLARRGAASDVLPALEPAPRHQVQSGAKISLAFPDLPRSPAPAVERESSPAGGERDGPAGPFA